MDDAAYYAKKLLHIMLEKSKHRAVGEAQTGSEGIEKYKKLKPHK